MPPRARVLYSTHSINQSINQSINRTALFKPRNIPRQRRTPDIGGKTPRSGRLQTTRLPLWTRESRRRRSSRTELFEKWRPTHTTRGTERRHQAGAGLRLDSRKTWASRYRTGQWHETGWDDDDAVETWESAGLGCDMRRYNGAVLHRSFTQ